MLPNISTEHILEVLHEFYHLNSGDDSTQSIILAIGAEICDVSEDTLLEHLE